MRLIYGLKEVDEKADVYIDTETLSMNKGALGSLIRTDSGERRGFSLFLDCS